MSKSGNWKYRDDGVILRPLPGKSKQSTRPVSKHKRLMKRKVAKNRRRNLGR